MTDNNRKHTPGPWHVGATDDGALTVNGFALPAALVRANRGRALADQALMAAAPDLLAACEALLADPHSTKAARLAIRAIAKAKVRS